MARRRKKSQNQAPQETPKQAPAQSAQEAAEQRKLEAEERRRGDQLIAWLTIGLGLLLPICFVAGGPEGSAFWRHLALGRDILANGLWPPAADPLHYSVPEDAGWYHPGWLFDLLVYGGYRFGGANLLVACKTALVAWAALMLLALRRKGPTLWPAAAIAIAVLAVWNADMQVAPRCLTLVFSVAMLLMLHRFERSVEWPVWRLVPLFVVWVNLDPQWYLGGSIVCVWLIGLMIQRRLSASRSDAPLAQREHKLLFVVGALFVAAMFNPWGWLSLTNPWLLAAGDQARAEITGPASYSLLHLPEREAFFSRLFWREHITLVLLGFAAIGFLLNRRRWNGPHLCAAIVALTWTLLSLRNAPFAALMLGVTGSLAWQQWWQDRETPEQSARAFAMAGRLGRVMTVLAIFAVAVLGMTGRLRNSPGSDFGWSLAPGAQDDLAEMRSLLADLPDDARAFNMTPDQGDLLVWLSGPRSAYLTTAWVDVGAHRETATAYVNLRKALRDNEDHVWRRAFNTLDVDYALLDMHQPRAFIITCNSLWRSGQWECVHLGGTIAAFVRHDAKLPDLETWLSRHRWDPGDVVFGVELPPPLEPVQEAPGPPEWFRDKFWRTDVGYVPPEVSTAINLFRLSSRSDLIPAEQLPYALLAVRSLRSYMALHPEYRGAYSILARVYKRLQEIELQVGSAYGFRARQTIAAYEAALRTIDTRKPSVSELQIRLDLAQVYLDHQDLDAALIQIHKLAAVANQRELTAPVRGHRAWEFVDRVGELEDAVNQVRSTVDSARDKSEPWQRAQFALEQGCPLLAIEELDPPGQLAELAPADLRMLIDVLLSTGQAAAARQALNKHDVAAAQLPPGEREWIEGWISLLQGNYWGAEGFWVRSVQATESQLQENLLESYRALLTGAVLPLVNAAGVSYGPPRLERSERHALLALVLLEAGQPAEAREALRNALEGIRDDRLQLLVRYYWEYLSGQPLNETVLGMKADDTFGDDLREITPITAPAKDPEPSGS